MLLHLTGWAVTKGRDIINFVNCQPLFDVHWQYLWTFLTDLQAEASRFRCRIFHYFAYFSKFSSIIISFIFYKLSTGDCLAFGVI